MKSLNVGKETSRDAASVCSTLKTTQYAGEERLVSLNKTSGTDGLFQITCTVDS